MAKFKSFKDSLEGKDLQYSDPFLELKKESVITNDSFSYNNYDAFKDINDFKTNNYSNLFLLKKQKNSEWLKANVKERDNTMGIVTTLSFFNGSAYSEKNPGSFIYFAKNYEFFDISLKRVECILTKNRPETAYLNYIFFIDFLDDCRCRISHTFGDIVFYLAVEADKTIHFVKDIEKYQNQPDENNDNTTFIYNVDGQNLRLFKQLTVNTYDDEDELVDTQTNLFVLGIDRTDDNQALVLLDDTDSLDERSLLYITNNILDFDFYVNSSWVGYDRSQYIDSIDSERSAFNLQSQVLVHHQYNDNGNVNFIPLKNHQTYRGNTIRGDHFTFTSEKYPDVNFRNYNAIHSGLNQEKGNDTIILSYTFHDQEYEIKPGDDFFFTIPKVGEHSNLSPLFPYEYINIKDTKFVKNGAFGSSVPQFADKFKKLQNHRQSVNGETNNVQYLCTWLYKANESAEPIWLDRWYYPNYITKRELVKQGGKFDPSYENLIDKNYVNPERTDEAARNEKIITRNTYFDKASDLTIEPGCTYCYQRLSRDMVDEVIEGLEKYRVFEVYNQNGKVSDIAEKMTLNGENWLRIKYDQLHNTNQLNVNFDIYLDASKKIGPQLFGNDYTNGINIQNRKDLCPYLYYSTNEEIFMLNNKYEIQHKFNLTEKYNDYIVKFIQGDMFSDIVLVSPLNIYILTYDLRLKTRMSLIIDEKLDGQEYKRSDKSILGLKDLKVMLDGKRVPMMNYPYGNTHISIPKVNITSQQLNISIKLEQPRKIDVPKLIAPKRRNIGKVADRGYVVIPSRAAQMMAEQNSILYNNNLYIPFNQQILKLIFCPDVEGEFTPEERTEYPAKIRTLDYSEFTANYPMLTDSAYESETLATIGGNIDIQNKIKHIYIDSNGKIYGLNFDHYSLAADGDTIYGLYAWDQYVSTGGGWWLFNQSLSKIHSDVSTSKYAEFQSMNSIDMVRFNARGEMALVRNFNNLPDNKNSDNQKRLEIFSKAKIKEYEYDLTEFSKVYALDAYNYINEAAEEKSVIVLLGVKGGYVTRVMYDADTHTFTERYTPIPVNCNEMFYETVNSNALLRYGQKNCLYFNMFFPSTYLYPYVGTIVWNLQDLQTGWYNINVSADLINADFSVKINDIPYQSIRTDWFAPYVNANGNMFANTYYVGCLGKQYGSTLNEIIKNSPYDPYTCKNSSMENLTIYRKRLEYYEYQAMRLNTQNINTLFITIPCGIRNNIDEMVRYFRYNTPGAISNRIRINVAGTGLQTAGEFDMLRQELLNSINNQKDCLVQVEDIQFLS